MVGFQGSRCAGGAGRGLMAVSLAGIAALMAGGCQSYERQPLDMAAHREAFLARTPESPEVKAFAEGLKERARSSRDGGNGFDATDGVTRDEAEVIALVFNAGLRVARERAGVAKAGAEHAGLWEDPELGVDVSRIVESVPEPWKVLTSVGITLPISGRLEAEKRRAGAEHAAELARVARDEWAVRMSVRRAWCEWSALAAQLDVTRDFLSRVDQVLAVVDTMERAGEMARTEARLFRIERATKAADLRVLEARARDAELGLRRLMGVSPDAAMRFEAGGFEAGGFEAGGLEAGGVGPDAMELERRSPALVVAAAEYEAAERALELAVREQYPDVRIGPGYGREDGQDQVLLGVSLPIPVVNGNRRGIAEARARREVARVAAEAALEETIAALRRAELRLAAAAERRRSLETEIVPLVDAQYADARQVARLGEVNALVLLESLTRQQAAKVGLVEAARDEAIAGVDVVELMGPELAGVGESEAASGH